MHSAHRSRVTLLRYRPDIFETFQSIFNFSLLLQQVWTQLSQLEFLNGHWTCGKICIFDSSIVVTVKLYGRTEDKHFFEKFQLIFLKIRIISCFTKVNVHFENTFSPPSVYILLRVKIIVNKRRINLHYISIIMTSIRVYAISRKQSFIWNIKHESLSIIRTVATTRPKSGSELQCSSFNNFAWSSSSDQLVE